MIINDPQLHFVILFSKKTHYGNDPGAYIKYKGKRLTNKEVMEHWGKWVILEEPEQKGQQMEKLAAELDPLVEQEIIPCCKYDRSPVKEFSMLQERVMCVFCDDRQRDEIKQILSDLGAAPWGWIHERDVIKGWSPGGLFLEHWISAHGYEGEEAEEIREDSRRAMEQVYGDEDALCYGWKQQP